MLVCFGYKLQFIASVCFLHSTWRRQSSRPPWATENSDLQALQYAYPSLPGTKQGHSFLYSSLNFCVFFCFFDGSITELSTVRFRNLSISEKQRKIKININTLSKDKRKLTRPRSDKQAHSTIRLLCLHMRTNHNQTKRSSVNVRLTVRRYRNWTNSIGVKARKLFHYSLRRSPSPEPMNQQMPKCEMFASGSPRMELWEWE